MILILVVCGLNSLTFFVDALSLISRYSQSLKSYAGFTRQSRQAHPKFFDINAFPGAPFRYCNDKVLKLDAKLKQKRRNFEENVTFSIRIV